MISLKLSRHKRGNLGLICVRNDRYDPSRSKVMGKEYRKFLRFSCQHDNSRTNGASLLKPYRDT